MNSVTNRESAKPPVDYFVFQYIAALCEERVLDIDRGVFVFNFALWYKV